MTKRVKLISLILALVVLVASVFIYVLFINNTARTVYKPSDETVGIFYPSWLSEDKLCFITTFRRVGKGDELNILDLSTEEITGTLNKVGFPELVSVDRQKTVMQKDKSYLWIDFDAESTVVNKKIEVKMEDFWPLSMSPLGRFLIGASKGENNKSTIKILDTETETYISIDNLVPREKIAGFPSIFDNGDIIYSSKKRELIIRSAETGEEEVILVYGHEEQQLPLIIVSPDNNLVALNFFGYLGVVDLTKREIKHFAYGFGHGFMQWSRDNKYIVYSSHLDSKNKDLLILCDVESGDIEIIASHKGYGTFQGFDISPDNSKVVYAPYYREIKVIELK